MKKFLTLMGIAALTTLYSCDDGDLIYNDIDFSADNAVAKCSNIGAEKIFYKIQKDETLILVVDVANLMKDPTLATVSTSIDGKQTSLQYRKYSDNLSSDNICNIPSPAFPNVIKSIDASAGGTIRINRDIAMNYNNSSPNNPVGLIYQYAFYLENINFHDQETNIKYDKMFFGTNNYAERSLSFDFINQTQRPLFSDYSCQDKFYALSDKEALVMELGQLDLPDQPGEQPTRIAINSQHKVSFKQYKRTGINLDQVCQNPGDIPGTSESTLNTLEELWNATSGEFVIQASWTSPVEGERQLKYQISLVNVVFNKDQYEHISFTRPIIELGEFY
ncbi:hypothetical protein [Myroides sp. LJL119]